MNDMNSNNKNQTIGNEVIMLESDEDFSEDEDSEEGEQISAGNEVSFKFLGFRQKKIYSLEYFRKFKLISKVEIQLIVTPMASDSYCVNFCLKLMSTLPNSLI